MEQAIKKAIEGGYRYGFYLTEDGKKTNEEKYNHAIKSCILDPLFWQALGKAEGWRQDPSRCTGCQTIGCGKANHMTDCPEKNRPVSWNENWHKFIDHLAKGEDVDSFFKDLLNL